MMRSELGWPRNLILTVWAAQGLFAVFPTSALGAEEPPRLVVVPLSQGEGAPDRAAASFTSLLVDELKSREGVSLVLPEKPKGAADPATPGAEAKAALAEGKAALTDLRFPDAAAALKRGIELSLTDPSTADFTQVFDAYVSIAVAYFRMGEEKSAQQALFNLARLAPSYKLADGKFPPVFSREFDKARKRTAKLAKGALSIEGPPGATAFVDGRDLGMVPVVEEELGAGPHYVKVEGTRGERFGQVVEVKPGTNRVKATLSPAPAPVAAPVAAATSLKVPAVIDAEVASRIGQLAKAAGADLALVGMIYRTGEHQLTAATALYSVKRQGLISLTARPVDHQLLTANVEAFKLAEEASARAGSFGAPEALPLRLLARPTATAAKPLPSAEEPATPSGSRVALKPSAIDARREPAPDEPEIEKPTPTWVWVAVGVGAAAVAGGTYYGVTQATRPVTGTVTARW